MERHYHITTHRRACAAITAHHGRLDFLDGFFGALRRCARIQLRVDRYMDH
ncbi:hypothetical protein SAMN05444007_11562 [Cribrihabitans marinus]|uniref:Uncharacterized protein n=2 Tax=Cribrihabitans marinus TaxID=1227549 RepID=A0A1H7E308_9RHOB|nr:hypothetical protein SAMN05444007_11562 [Cribrihabitans marinus]